MSLKAPILCNFSVQNQVMYSKLPPPLEGQMQTAVSLLVYKASLGTALPTSSTLPPTKILAFQPQAELCLRWYRHYQLQLQLNIASNYRLAFQRQAQLFLLPHHIAARYNICFPALGTAFYFIVLNIFFHFPPPPSLLYC